MNDCSLRLYSQYDHDRGISSSEARIKVPHIGSAFLLSFSGYGEDDNAATDDLIRKLEDNAKTLQAISDSLKAEKKTDNSKRQPIKEQTLDEFNNARQVAYGNNVQVKPLTNDEADLSHEAWLDFKVKNKPQAERAVKWLIREYDIKLD